VHNLRAINWGAEEEGYDWAERFDHETRALMQNEPTELGRLRESTDYPLSVPTADHFLPLAYLAGLAGVADTKPDVLVDGCTLGSLSMTAYTIGAAA